MSSSIRKIIGTPVAVAVEAAPSGAAKHDKDGDGWLEVNEVPAKEWAGVVEAAQQHVKEVPVSSAHVPQAGLGLTALTISSADTITNRSVFIYDEAARSADEAFRNSPRNVLYPEALAKRNADGAYFRALVDVGNGGRTAEFLKWTAKNGAKIGAGVGAAVGFAQSTFDAWRDGEYNAGSIANIAGTTLYEAVSGAVSGAVGITAGVAAGTASSVAITPVGGAVVGGIVGTTTSVAVKSGVDTLKDYAVESIYGWTQGAE